MNRTLATIAFSLALSSIIFAQDAKPLPELPYRAVPSFFKFPQDAAPGEVSAVAINSKGHIYVFRRAKPMLCEFGADGRFIRSLPDGAFSHPHGLRIDSDDNLWTTDDGNHLVLKLDPQGNVLLVLGHADSAGEADWLFNRPADVAFDSDRNIYVADGYGNSRIMKFDRTGKFIKSWGKFGHAAGDLNLPHTIAIDASDRVYVGDRENQRIEIFDRDGKFVTQWTGIGYPYGLFITPDQHVWMVDGGYDRIVELDRSGHILGAFGEPGHDSGQLAWGHFLAISPAKDIYVADVLNWRVQAFKRGTATGKLTSYIPSKRKFWGFKRSDGWMNHRDDMRSDADDVSQISTTIKGLEDELARAVVARDYPAIKRIEAESYVYTDSDARVNTRDEFIEAYKSGASAIPSLRFHDMVVDVYGDVAVVRGILTVARTDEGVAMSRSSR